MGNIVIGIEGHVGAGKTSICRELINRIPNTVLLNGGNLYRAVVYTLMKHYKTIDNLVQNTNNIDIKETMDKLKVEIRIENKETQIYVDNKKMKEENLQSAEASLAVSMVGGKANNQNLFRYIEKYVDELKKEYNVIISGRSIMLIYPKTDYHFFVTASLEERIRRKSIQYNGKVDLKELEENIVKRDKLQEEAGFYKIYDNTIIVDVTDCKNVEESTNKVLKNIKIPQLV